jgi:hypothetical protein
MGIFGRLATHFSPVPESPTEFDVVIDVIWAIERRNLFQSISLIVI